MLIRGLGTTVSIQENNQSSKSHATVPLIDMWDLFNAGGLNTCIFIFFVTHADQRRRKKPAFFIFGTGEKMAHCLFRRKRYLHITSTDSFIYLFGFINLILSCLFIAASCFFVTLSQTFYSYLSFVFCCNSNVLA